MQLWWVVYSLMLLPYFGGNDRLNTDRNLHCTVLIMYVNHSIGLLVSQHSNIDFHYLVSQLYKY